MPYKLYSVTLGIETQVKFILWQKKIEVDDTECIKYILNHLPETLKGKISEEDVQYVLDVICDYYAENDLFDEEDKVEEAFIAEEDMFQYINKIINKEKIVNITEEELQAILDGEFEYGKKIGIYTEETEEEE